MATAVLILAAVLVVVLIGVVCTQSVRDPFMWLFHTCCGTLGTLLHLLALIVSAITGGGGGSDSASSS